MNPSTQRFPEEDLELVRQAKQSVTSPCPYWVEDEREHAGRPCDLCEARAVLVAFTEAGRLMPAGGQKRTEHEIDWRHRDREQDNPTMTYQDFTEQQVDQEIASADSLGYEPRQVRRRFITTWPDGATFTGAWETR